MRARMKVEFARLREVYGEVEHAEAGGEDWFKIPSYPLPEGWMVSDQSSATVPIVFLVKADYPGGSPYGFLTPVGLNFQGAAPNNTGEAPGPVPFEGDWIFFSWHCEDWPGCNELRQGPDLVSWCRSFKRRLSEGA